LPIIAPVAAGEAAAVVVGADELSMNDDDAPNAGEADEAGVVEVEGEDVE
jgi:hypothetical protein